MDFIIDWVNNLTKSAELTALLTSFIPLIELKGAILFARGSGLGFFSALFYSYIGSTAVFLPIFLLLTPILNRLKKIRVFNSFALKCEGFFQKKADSLMEKNKNKKGSPDLIKMWGVFVFVAIPLPMTGVWTGTAVAVFLGLKLRQVILPVCAGNLVAGLIISVLGELFLDYVNIILYGVFGLAIILLAVTIIKVAITKPSVEPSEKEKTERNKD